MDKPLDEKAKSQIIPLPQIVNEYREAINSSISVFGFTLISISVISKLQCFVRSGIQFTPFSFQQGFL